MRFSYDPEVDILVIQLVENQRERFSHGTRLPFGDAVADLDGHGAILSLEILDASTKYPMDVLLANQVRYAPLGLAEAAAIAGSTVDALKKAIARNRLQARKVSGVWTVERDDLNAYLNDRWQRSGRQAATAV